MHSYKDTLPNSFVFPSIGRAMVVSALAVALAACGKDPLAAGRGHMQIGSYKAAVIEFKNAVQAQPDAVEARLALADALERTFDLAGAEQHLRKALERGGDPNTLLPRIAFLMLDGGQNEKLVRDFKDRRLDSQAADSNLRAAVAAALVGQGKVTLAAEQLQAVREATPAVQLAKAQILATEGKRTDALAVLEGTPAEAKNDWWTLRAWGRLYLANGDRENALATLKKAYDAAPWHPGVTSEYGELLISVGRLDEATTLRDRLRSMAPNSHWGSYLDALVQARQGHVEETHAAALRTLAVAPEHRGAMLLAASAEIKKGDYLVAENRLKKFMKQNPDALAAHQLYARTQFMTGKLEEAKDIARRGLSLEPKDPELLGLLADIEVKQGNRKAAVANLETLLTIRPEDAATLLRLSQLKASLGDRSAANELLDRAASIGKDNPVLRDQIVSTALRAGDSSRARQLGEYAVKSQPQDPASHLTLAAALATQNDMAGAWKAANTALDLEPALRPALIALAGLSKTDEQRKELDARYAKAVQAKGAVPQVFLDYVGLLRAEGKEREIFKAVLEKGLAAHSNSVAIRAALVEEELRAGGVEKALSLAQAGAAVANAPADALALLGEIYGRLGKNDQATETYRKLAADYPQRADWRLRLAQLEAGVGRMAEATTLLRTLIADRPFDVAPYVSLANLMVAEQPREALSIARQLGEVEGRKPAAMLLEGELLAKAGKPEEALQQLAAASRAGAQPAAQLEAIKILDRSGKKQMAGQQLADALRRFPEYPAVLAFASDRYMAQGEPEKAIEYARKLVDRDPANPLFLNELAWKEILTNRPDALAHAKKAAALLPDNPTVLHTLGMALARSGKREDAIVILRTAVNLAPSAAQPRIDLAEQLLASGDRKTVSGLIKHLDAKVLTTKQQEALARLQNVVGG